jgi:hypothetical protein
MNKINKCLVCHKIIKGDNWKWLNSDKLKRVHSWCNSRKEKRNLYDQY